MQLAFSPQYTRLVYRALCTFSPSPAWFHCVHCITSAGSEHSSLQYDPPGRFHSEGALGCQQRTVSTGLHPGRISAAVLCNQHRPIWQHGTLPCFVIAQYLCVCVGGEGGREGGVSISGCQASNSGPSLLCLPLFPSTP